MPYDPNKHHRRSIRLEGYDYGSAGAYFITICAYKNRCIFGEVVDGVMHRNRLGDIVHPEWLAMIRRRPYVKGDAFVVMPNHFHAILWIVDDEREGRRLSGSGKARRPKATPVRESHRAFAVDDRGGVQGDGHEAHQCRPEDSRRARVASESSRTHHPRRACLAQHPALYRNEPEAVAARPAATQVTVTVVGA